MTARKLTRQEHYEAEMEAWVDEQLETAPPLNEQQKMLIRSAFSAHRRDKAAAAKKGAAA
jgi:hypothetical protein